MNQTARHSKPWLKLGQNKIDIPNKNSRKPNGYYNELIRECIKNGMRLNSDNRIMLPSGRLELYKKPNELGYYRITLYVNGKKATINRSRIICWLSHGEPPNDRYLCDHINLNKSDDRPENLRWVNDSDNVSNVSEENKRKRSEGMKLAWKEIRRLRASHDALVEALKECVEQLKFYDGHATIRNHDKELIEKAESALKLESEA